MSQFIESIRFEGGKYHLLELHQERVDRTFATFYPNLKPQQLTEILPAFQHDGKYKFRVVYNQNGYQVEHAIYYPRVINTVQLIEANDLDYSFKYADRTELNKLVEKSEADEIIIIKNGLVTDTSYSNIACFDGEKWWTPEQPLLAGTRRQDLLNRGLIFPRGIQPNELQEFKKVCLINAMLDLGELELSKIRL